MKNFIFVILLLGASSVFGNSISLQTISGIYYNSMFNMTQEINITTSAYKDDTDSVIFQLGFQPTIVAYTAYFNKQQREELLTGLKKYVEWRKIAIENNVSHEKEISTIRFLSIYDSVYKTYGQNPALTLTFKSSSPTEHYLLFTVHEVPTAMIVKITPEPFFLSESSVTALIKILDDPNFEKNILEKLGEKDSTDSLFQ